MSTAVFVMSDVVGSTALWEAHGDAMRSALEVHDRLVHGAVESAGGRVFKHTGDGMIAVFDDADDAARGALGATGALADGDWGVVGRLEIRVSVHAGSASERDGDFFGPPVNKVARINGVGHPGQVLVSDVARQLMGEPAGVDLGAHQLRDLSEAVRLWQLDDGDHPALRTLVKSRHNLPAMPTEFVGRQDEVDEVRNLVRTNRLVTITGVGGCGKTRAAVEVAAASADSFDGGVWFVDLTAERDGSAVGACVLGAMGLVQPLSEQYMDPVVALVEASQGSATLIVVDNCEHLIDDVAEFAEQVLAEAPMVTMLATSREALAVEGERAWRIPNLQAAAVELFLDRAAGVGVADLDEHLEIVEQICTALDDIPLAIELAASQAATLSLEELSTRLDNRFALLGGGRRSGRRRQRQQTLQTMMDWSYELLTDDEQMLLRELSVFAGSFAAAGVEAVATASPTPVLARLQSLVQQSLVMPLRDTGRYRLLETVRLYALDKLIALDAVADTRDRHLTWVHQSFNPAGLTQVQAVDIWANENRLWAEVENSIAAMEWAEETGDTEALFDVFVTYGSVWANDNRYTRIGLSWLDRVPIPPPTEPLNRTMWLGTSGLMHFNLGDLNSSIEIFLEGASYVDELRAADPQYFVTWSQVIFFRANMYSSLGDYDAALADAELLAELANECPNGAPFLRWMSYLSRVGTPNDPLHEMAERALQAIKGTSDWAEAIATASVAGELLAAHRYEESLALVHSCLDAPLMNGGVRTTTIVTGAMACAELGRFDEAFEIIEADLGPMLEAQRRLQLKAQLTGLGAVLAKLDGSPSLGQLASIALNLSRDIYDADWASHWAGVLGSKEAVDEIIEPLPSELELDRVSELVGQTLIEAKALVASLD